MKFTQKLKDVFGKSAPIPLSTKPEQTDALSRETIYRYRRQYGVNLGSWFVLERWITDVPFLHAASPAQSDLDIAKGQHAKQVLEHHWDTWILDDDLVWLEEKGFNSIRLPIGFYHLCGFDPSVIQGTDFEPFHDTYSGAWERIARFLQTAETHNFGVLIDLHAAPGKQNNDAHSGSSAPTMLFSNPWNLQKTLQVLETLLRALKSVRSHQDRPLCNIIGIELLNEPAPSSDQQLQKWYDTAISRLHQMDSDIPVYLADCWRSETYTEYIAKKSPKHRFLVLDHHVYRCFTQEDISTSAADHAESFRNGSTCHAISGVAEKVGRAGGGLVIGEWSGALNPGSLRGTPNEKRDYVDAQLQLFDRFCGGWYFWTYKKQERGDTGWSLRDAIEQGVFPSSVGIRRPSSAKDIPNNTLRCNEAKEAALNTHVEYWKRYPGKYHHERFEQGFVSGWKEAYRFMTFSYQSQFVSRLGFAAAWAHSLTNDHDNGYWEFETGFIQGIGAAEKDYSNL